MVAGSLTCIADTNSIQFLSQVQLARRQSWYWLRDDFNVCVSDVVSSEINHPANPMNRTIKTWARNSSVKVDLNACKRAFSNAKIDPPDDGEFSSLYLGLTLVRRRPSRGLVVFLSDDERALSFAKLRPEFRATTIRWRSHDAILYTYIRHHARIGLRDAQIALRDVHALASNRSRGPKWDDLLGKYLLSLEDAFKILQHLN